MNMSKWTRVLLGAGLISLPAVARADDTAEPQPVMTALNATTLSGYIDTSAVWKFGTGDANMPGRTYDGPDVQDGFNLNVVSLTLDKPPGDSPWGAGYHVQMLMGPGAAPTKQRLPFGFRRFMYIVQSRSAKTVERIKSNLPMFFSSCAGSLLLTK